MRLLVIGFGNPLRSDDGFGWRVAEALRDRAERAEVTGPTPPFDVITCQQLNPELAEPISRADLAVFVDAAEPAAVPSFPVQPGSIIECDLEPTCQSPQCFSHDLTPSTLLACAGELFGSCPKGKLLSVVGADFGMGETLTESVLAAVPEVTRRIEALASEVQIKESRTASLPR